MMMMMMMMMKRQMRRKWWCCFMIVMTMQMFCWVSVGSTRLFTAHHDAPPPQQQQQQQQQHQAVQVQESSSSSSSTNQHGDSEEVMMGVSRLGSRPPRCEYKCRGCVPCDAIQTPTNTDRFTLHYANYEPEGWKCKCGPSLFNP